MTRRLNILVVEDDRALRDLYRELLSEEGHDVRTAADGSEAMTMLGGPLDLVVTDLNMPRMSGDVFLQEMRKIGTLEKLPVLVVTAFPEDLPKSLHGPRTTVLRKPFHLEAFGEYIGVIAKGGVPAATPMDQ